MTTEANPTNDEIIALETSYWEAIKAKNGARTSQLSGNVSLVTGAQGVMSIAKSEMGIFSIFKRGMRGVYQHCSEKHLHRYLA